MSIPSSSTRYPHYSDLGERARGPRAMEQANLREWSAYLGGKVSDENLRFLLYKMKLADLDRLIWALEGQSAVRSARKAPRCVAS